MSRQLNPTQKIWALFALELLILVALVISIERFQTAISNQERQVEWNTGAWVSTGHSPRTLTGATVPVHHLFHLSVQTDRVVDSLCLVFVLCSCWLAHAVYQVGRLRWESST